MNTRGWLYVSTQSATFVSDDTNTDLENYTWSVLADRLLLESFLTFFVPIKQHKESSYDSYYIELDRIVLKAWFECLIPSR